MSREDYLSKLELMNERHAAAIESIDFSVPLDKANYDGSYIWGNKEHSIMAKFAFTHDGSRVSFILQHSMATLIEQVQYGAQEMTLEHCKEVLMERVRDWRNSQ